MDISPGRPPTDNCIKETSVENLDSLSNTPKKSPLSPSTLLSTPQTKDSKQQPSFSTMPALQLFSLSNAASAAAGLNSARGADVFELKLRRRYAQEWEFLATILDRVLLIVFSALVALVKGLF